MKIRLLHTMLRVGDLDRSVDFYTQALGMSLLRKFDNPSERYTLAFLGYGPEENTTVIELTYNYGVSAYERGRYFGHIAIGVERCAEFCDRIRLYPAKITREASPLRGGTEIIAFAEDPDGNSIELIQRADNWFPSI